MRLPGSILQGILARAALTFLRIYLGAVFVLSAWPRIMDDSPPSLESPKALLLAVLISWGELLVGGTLILGLVTRLSATGALLLSINSLLVEGTWLRTPSASDLALACIAIALIIGAAGRTFGLDTFLARRWRRSPFW